MSHYQERIDSLVDAMGQSGFRINNPSEEPLKVKSEKKNVRFRADVLYEGTRFGLSVEYTNFISPEKAGGYETYLDPDISWIGLSRSLPEGDYTILPDSDLTVDLIRFYQPNKNQQTGMQQLLDKFGEGKTIKWDEVTAREIGVYGKRMSLEYDFLHKPTRRCNFEMDISTQTIKAKRVGSLPNHDLQVEQNHFCIIGDEYPLFPFSLQEASVEGIRLSWLHDIGKERFNQLFAGIPLSGDFQVVYRDGAYIQAGRGALRIYDLVREISLEPVAMTLRENMDLFEQFYQGFSPFQ